MMQMSSKDRIEMIEYLSTAISELTHDNPGMGLHWIEIAQTRLKAKLEKQMEDMKAKRGF
jgi:hypothetical protein